MRVLGKDADPFNAIHVATLTSDGKRVLFVSTAEASVQDVETGQKVPLAAATSGEKPDTAIFTADEQKVAGRIMRYATGNIETPETQIVLWSAAAGRQLASATVPGSYDIVGVIGSG